MVQNYIFPSWRIIITRKFTLNNEIMLENAITQIHKKVFMQYFDYCLMGYKFISVIIYSEWKPLTSHTTYFIID